VINTNLPPILHRFRDIAHERYRRQTDRRQTDDRRAGDSI